MSKYLNVFNTLAEYQAFSASTEYVQPNVALVKETNVLYYDYGDNKPQVDLSDLKVESEEISLGGDKFGNSAITKINYIPSGVTSLRNAFSNYSSIVTSPEIPNSVEDISSTFNNCTSLVNVTNIPNSVKRVEFTFQTCTSLVNVPPIPSGVESMTWAFMHCSSLKEVTLLPTTPPSYSSTLDSCPKLESIYVPDESVDAYKTASGWSQFADKFKPLSAKQTV